MNPDELAELEEQRTFLVRSLDDLDRELAAGDIDALDATTLRADYTHRLAEVQRAIETGHAELVHRAPPRRPGRVVASVALVAALGIGAGVAVASAAGSRKPGQSVTGTIREKSTDLLNRAAALQDENKFLDAIKVYDEVIASDPENGEALAERGFLLLRLTMGRDEPKLVHDGQRYIERALAIEPQNPRWLFYRAVGLRLAGDDAAASKAFDDALAADPPAELKQFIEQFRASIGG